MAKIVERTETLEYGHVPISPFSSHLNSLNSLKSFQRELLRQGQNDQHGRCFVTLEEICEALDANTQQTQVLLDLLAAVTDDDSAVRLEGGRPVAADAYRLVLFLLIHYYTREAARADTADVWPSDQPFSSQAEPSSPMRLTKAWSREQAHHRAHLPATRQKMQEHLQYQEALYCGFAPFLARHAPDIIALVSDPIGEEEADLDDDVLGGPIEEPPAASSLSPLQVDRLGFLFKVESDSGEPGVGPGGSQGGGAAAEPRPMDEDTSPFNPSAHSKSQPGNARLSEALSSLWGADGTVPVTSVAAWIRESLAGAGPHRDTSFDPMMGTSPPRISMFNQLAPSIPTMIERWDVYAVHKATAVRGESDLPGGSVRVVDCHDAVVYCLAPLQYATITCCTDCIVVLGAVGKAVRVERCERIQVIAAACSVTVNTCHDCIFYLGVNRPPLLLGDNRFLQFAPHNAPYERLPEHLAASGVLPTPNAWNMHVQLLPDHSKHHHAPLHSSSPSPKVPSPLSQMAAMETEGSASGTSGSNQPPCATLLPPEKLMPFLVPFQGGRGPLCGGPALPNRDTGSSDDTISGLLTHGDAGAAAFSRCPFPLPAEYAAAWEAKTSGVASVRAAYREAHLDEARKREFMAAIQTQFKEWLQAGGGMREVYDLAKLEKERRAESMAAGSNDVI